MFALPKLMIGKYNIAGEEDGGLSSALCSASTVTGNTVEDICSTSSKGKTAGHLAVFVISQLLMGTGTTPLYTLGMLYSCRPDNNFRDRTNDAKRKIKKN